MDTNTLLIAGSSSLGVALTPGQVAAFETYLTELLKWNKKVNLTAVVEPRDVVIKHFLDALALCRMLPDGPSRAADIGSGAGFPGLALKIVRPDMEISLIEPSGKKAAFLRHMIRLLGLGGATVIEARAEGLAEGHAGYFDLILSRAFKGPSQLLPIAGPLLKPDGRAILSLGPGASELVPAGWRVEAEEEVVLPFSDYRRRLVSFVCSTWNTPCRN